MLYVKSLLFNILFFIWTVLIVLSCVPGIVFSQKWIIWVAYYWGIGTHFLLKHLVNITYEIRGRENWDGKPAIFASKHQSILETTMIQVLAFNSAIILKRELTLIPIFGQVITRAGIIAINRSKGREVIKQLIIGTKKFLQQNRPVFIFPEGTRVSHSNKTKLRYGIAALYNQVNVQVIPVALNSGAFWGRRQFLRKPGKVIYHILPAIQPGMDEQKFLKHLESVIEQGCQNINEEISNGSKQS